MREKEKERKSGASSQSVLKFIKGRFRPCWDCSFVMERKFLATIISSLSGLYHAIIESLKPETGAGVN